MIELVVAVGIIGVLLAIMVPALGQARDQTRLILCQSNLRGIGTGMTMYADCNNSAFPVADKLDNPHLVLLAATQRYVDDPQTYYCPSLTEPDACFSPENVQAGRIGYFYYSCQAPPSDPGISTFLRWTVDWPRLLRADMDEDTWLASGRWFSGQPTSHEDYKKGVNYLKLSGAVAMVTSGPRESFR